MLNFKNYCTYGVVTPPLAIDCGTCLCTHVVVSRLLPIIIILLLLLLLLLSSSFCVFVAVAVAVAVGDDDIVDDNGEDGDGDGDGGGDDDVFEVNNIGSIGGVTEAAVAVAVAAAAAEDVTEHVTEVEIGGVNLLENPCFTFRRRRCTGRDEVDVDIIIACYGVYSAYQFVLVFKIRLSNQIQILTS